MERLTKRLPGGEYEAAGRGEAELLAAMDELGAEPARTVYVGDSEVDIDTARAAGIGCISVTWGFRTREQLIESGASVLVDDAAGLKREITG